MATAMDRNSIIGIIMKIDIAEIGKTLRVMFSSMAIMSGNEVLLEAIKLFS